MAVFGHIWPYLPIGGPSYLKLVGHCLNKVEHCIPYLGGRDGPLWTHQKLPRGGREGRYSQILPNMAKRWLFQGPSDAFKGHFGGSKGSQWPPQMWDTMFNRVQPVFNQFEAGKATYGQIWPKMAKNGRFGGPLRPPTVILVGAKGSKWPIPVVGYDVQPCSTNLRQLGLPMAK